MSEDDDDLVDPKAKSKRDEEKKLIAKKLRKSIKGENTAGSGSDEEDDKVSVMSTVQLDDSNEEK